LSRLAVFAYGSLVSPASAAQTLARPVRRVIPARLEGWRRGWTQGRDNARAEKGFARASDGSALSWCLGLDLKPETAAPAPNGALLELDEAELERLALREIRYDPVEVTDAVSPTFEGRVIAFSAKPQHHHPRAPAGAVIIAAYLRAVETAFAELEPGGLDEFRQTTGRPPVEVVEAVLVRDEIPPGNPREW